MSDESNNHRPGAAGPRRSSFAGQTFADLFGGRSRDQRGSFGDATNPTNPQQAPGPGPITTAAAQAQRRRLSLTTLGLSSSPDRFNSFRGPRDSMGSSASGSIDESAIEDDAPNSQSSMPTTPFQRRMSFGARALRDVRNAPSASAGGIAGQNVEGFNWSDNFRSRAERTSSTAGQGGYSSSPTNTHTHTRAQSIAAVEQPVREMPKEPNRPDHFQERILKGDFYMD